MPLPDKGADASLELDINNVGISSGDFAAGEIGHALDPHLEQIAREMRNYCYCRGWKIVMFLPLITTSQFCRMMNEAGFNAAEANGNSDNRSTRTDQDR